jgi:KipI family sensor histidine kinase inhibitor
MGERAALVEVDDAGAALSLALWARAHRVGAEEVVPAARTVLFAGIADPDTLTTELGQWRREEVTPSGPMVEVPVRYDGQDLADVARAWGMSVAEAIGAHTAQEYVVSFCGFAPGFAYLSGLPEALAVPRLATPRPRVPAGSVAVADAWCGVYPTSSPGGWRLLGRTEITLWDTSRDPPALLAPGTRVRFVEVS